MVPGPHEEYRVFMLRRQKRTGATGNCPVAPEEGRLMQDDYFKNAMPT